MSEFRPARAIDAPELIGILGSHYAASRFAGRAEIDPVYARKLFAQAVMRHGHTTDGGTWFEVMERGGVIEAFMLGTLQRAYMVGDKLVAQDVFFVARNGVDQRKALGLLDRFIAWGRENPRCIEVCVSYTDVIPGTERIGSVYRRKGFAPCGVIYRLTPDETATREAA